MEQSLKELEMSRAMGLADMKATIDSWENGRVDDRTMKVTMAYFSRTISAKDKFLNALRIIQENGRTSSY